MAPIRIGFIGLSSSATTQWASRAHLPYLLSPRGREKYQIVALLNSSVESARAAIAQYGLPAETRAYGDPEALAADPDVQLVVDVTRVDKHYPTALPSVKAGKDAFIEWPLADNLEHIRELADLARTKKIRTAVGIQGRLTPVFLKAREVLASGRIGKVLSTEVRAAGGTISRDILPLGMKYFTERKVGGNAYTIGFGHCKLRFTALEKSPDTCLVTLTCHSNRLPAVRPGRCPAFAPCLPASATGDQDPGPQVW